MKGGLLLLRCLSSRVGVAGYEQIDKVDNHRRGRLRKKEEEEEDELVLEDKQGGVMKCNTTATTTPTPRGHVPVYVGDEMERFAVPAKLLSSSPVFAQLLALSAQEYGYDQKGVLRIPCSVPRFRTLLNLAAAARGGGGDHRRPLKATL